MKMMKTLLAAAASIAILAGAGPVLAQMTQPMSPAPFQHPAYVSDVPAWMQDDGSSSDHPIHNHDDRSGQRLNSEYRDGITVPPPNGLPALHRSLGQPARARSGSMSLRAQRSNLAPSRLPAARNCRGGFGRLAKTRAT
jgi:hypothetical protein